MADPGLYQFEPWLEFVLHAWERARVMAADLDLPPSSLGKVVLFGCGDSHCAALGMEMLFSNLEGTHATALTAMHAGRYVLPTYVTRDAPLLAIGISASGEVARTVEAMEMAREIGASTLAVTCNPASRLAGTADHVLSLEVSELTSLEPGVPSYTAALVMLAGLAHARLPSETQRELESVFHTLAADFKNWATYQVERAVLAAREAEGFGAVFVGSGPAYGAAGFGAAKLLELSGEAGWRQDVEEWCHLEYFGRDRGLPTWLLSAEGRSVSREREFMQAVEAIGHPLYTSRWDGRGSLAEMLSPLVLWVAPLAYARARAEILHEKVFRGFAGGRSREEGGGASRIRTSTRLGLGDLAH